MYSVYPSNVNGMFNTFVNMPIVQIIEYVALQTKNKTHIMPIVIFICLAESSPLFARDCNVLLISYICLNIHINTITAGIR